MRNEVKIKIDSLIKNNPVVLFMKGSKEHPQCGFSKQVVEVLGKLLADFATCDILADQEMREAIKEYSSWPTIPQLYIDGEFIGGCDIVLDLDKQGELPKLLKISRATKAPHLEISPEAVTAFKNATHEKGVQEAIRISVSANFDHGLEFDEARTDDFIISIADLTIVIDPYSAHRADNLKIGFVSDKLDAGFAFDNPNEPPLVKEISVEELAAWQKSAHPHLLIDVRPRSEWDLAHINAAKPLEQLSKADIAQLDKNHPIVLHCHHGGRSRRTAETWRSWGFNNLYNLTGGIDAWSRKIDPKVPVYTK